MLPTPPVDPNSDAYLTNYRSPISRERLQALSKPHPFLGIAHVLGAYAMIFGVAALCELFWHPLLYVVSVMFIGARQMGLGILMHEGAHRRMHPNRKVNDVFSEAFVSWPLLLSMHMYRKTHFAHHRRPNTETDPDWLSTQGPDWTFPMPRARFAGIMLRELIGYGAITYMIRNIKGPPIEVPGKPSPRWVVPGQIVFYVGFVAALTLAGGWKYFLMYWLLPGFTWQQMVGRLRVIGEHFGLPLDHPLKQTRTTLLPWYERIFLFPYNINYHIEHHLHPTVPFYRLPELHAELMATPEYGDHAHVTRGYLGRGGVIAECTATP